MVGPALVATIKREGRAFCRLRVFEVGQGRCRDVSVSPNLFFVLVVGGLSPLFYKRRAVLYPLFFNRYNRVPIF